MTDTYLLPELCLKNLSEHMNSELFKALSDPVRISIIATLATKATPSTVSNLTECCGIDFSGVSRHLKILREAGIVSAEKQGRQMLYSLRIFELADSLRDIANALEGCRSETV